MLFIVINIFRNLFIINQIVEFIINLWLFRIFSHVAKYFYVSSVFQMYLSEPLPR